MHIQLLFANNNYGSYLGMYYQGSMPWHDRPKSICASSERAKKTVETKLRDKTMSARIYERFRVIEIAQQGYSTAESHNALGCISPASMTGSKDSIDKGLKVLMIHQIPWPSILAFEQADP